VDVGPALLGTWAAWYFGVEDRAPASFDWPAAGWHLTWSWAEFRVQVLVAVVGIAIAAALSNTIISDNYRERARERRMRNKT
jgi:heme exporter protein D